MSEWTKIPTPAASDRRLNDGEYRSLGRLAVLIWNESDDGVSAPRRPDDLAKEIGISRASLFRHLRTLIAAGYLEKREIRLGLLSLRILSLTRETPRPSSTALNEESHPQEVEGVLSSSRSHRLTGETLDLAEALAEVGVGEPARSYLAVLYADRIDYVLAHIAYAKKRRDPARLLIHRLREGDPEPDLLEVDPDGPDARRRYAESVERHR